MKISKRCEYAIRCLIDIEVHQKGHPIKVSFISERQEIPIKFLSAILTDLKKFGFVKSKKGPQGGYTLAQSSSNISLKNIINSIDGSESYSIDFHQIKKSSAAYSSQVLKDSLKEIEQAARKAMNQLTLRELTTRYHQLAKGDDSYSI